MREALDRTTREIKQIKGWVVGIVVLFLVYLIWGDSAVIGMFIGYFTAIVSEKEMRK